MNLTFVYFLRVYGVASSFHSWQYKLWNQTYLSLSLTTWIASVKFSYLPVGVISLMCCTLQDKYLWELSINVTSSACQHHPLPGICIFERVYSFQIFSMLDCKYHKFMGTISFLVSFSKLKITCQNVYGKRANLYLKVE